MLATMRERLLSATLAFVLLAAALPAFSAPVAALSSTSTLVVTSVNSSGSALKNACYAIFNQTSDGSAGSYRGGGCDGSDGSSDGKTTFSGLAPGKILVVERHAPHGYAHANPAAVTLAAGATSKLKMKSAKSGNKLVITTKNSVGSILKVACYLIRVVYGGQPLWVTSACDTDDGGNDGITSVFGLPGTSYSIQQYIAPAGYVAPAAKPVTFASTPSTVNVTVVNPSESDSSNVVIHVVDVHNAPVANICLSLYHTSGQTMTNYAGYSACTGSNGNAVLLGVKSGVYITEESQWPSGYLLIAPKVFTKSKGKLRTINFTIHTGGASISIVNLDSAGKKIYIGCWVAHNASGAYVEAHCDDHDNSGPDGATVLDGLPDGTYTLNEWQAPAGYKTASARTVTIAGGVSKTIKVKHAKLSASAASEKPAATPTKTPTTTPTAIPEITSTATQPPTAAATEMPTDVPTVEASPADEPTQEPTIAPSPSEPDGAATPIVGD